MNLTYDSTMFKQTFESEFTWLNGFMRNVRRFGYKNAAVFPAGNKSWTYEQLNAESNKLANTLNANGVKKSDIVLMQLFNSPEFLFGYIAPQKIGAISNPINFNLSPGETAEIMEHNKPKVYMYDSEVVQTAVKAIELCKHKPSIIVAVNNSKKEFNLPEGHILYDDFVKNGNKDNPPIDFAPHIYDEVVRLQTSGTTGTPKGVPLNNVNEVLSAHDVIMHFPINPTDVTMNMTPWFHRGGLHSGGPTPTLYAGASLVIMRTFNPKVCMEYVEKYKITFMTGVPSILTLLATRQEKHPKDLSSLKGIVTMGSPLEKEACIRFQKVLTPNIFNGYGTTETFWNTFLRPFDLPEMSGTSGRSCTDDEVRVVKVYDDKKAEPDETVPTDNTVEGEIIIKSPGKSTYCYVNNEKSTKEKFYKGWMYTGDIGTWDSKQYITIAGRKDDMIICKGENIYPARIEEVINCNEKVSECIVTGVPDSTRGESIAAYVIKADESLTIDELHDYCSSSPNLSKHQIPKYYRFVNELPHTATGKKQHFIIKNQAKQDLANGLLTRK
ncbi:AMP-binding protein [Ruminococcus sp. YE282]|jgi:acyl-coenzyme A synthetase/AMP-(fatty) acid ligase|uniref:class I adenylate-forming enzyme family protein n=1 Tax=Ruminococcus sp. YE282 TaxID=3158780 RepID=UPI00088B7836|nr:AMP-binding protein [Ruminococcus bromii]SCY59687.1 Acyl-CoA synthetase (AMP-forming)/AMP-acid ligase II [Ruminococcus bromii]